MKPMKTIFTIFTALVLICVCKLNAQTVYVDASNNTGIEDGTSGHPYNTVAEGIEAAITGDSVYIFSGEYPETASTELNIKDGTIIVGQDSANTRIAIPFYTGESTLSHYTELLGLSFPAYTISNGEGAATLKLKGCHVGEVSFNSASGYTFIVEECTIDGFLTNNSGTCYLMIRNNHFLDGGIIDKGAAPEGIEAHIIEDNLFNRQSSNNPDEAVIDANSTSITVKNNIINVNCLGSGISLKSGPPTNVIGNTISLSSGDLTNQTCGIFTKAGYGVVSDNSITGGYIAYFSSSGAILFENNTIIGSHTGIISEGAELVQGNTIKNCTGNGFIGNGLAGPVQNNFFIDNDSSGIVLNYPVDLGGGAKNGDGWNTLQNNGYFDLLINYSPTEQDTLYARYNLWDHDTKDEILSEDILNNSENLSIQVIDFITFPDIPLLQSPTNNSSGVDVSAQFIWHLTSVSDLYHLQLSYNSNFTNFIADTTGLKEAQFNISLEPETNFFWRVKAANPSGSSDWSETWQFSTGVIGIEESEKDRNEFITSPNPARNKCKVQSSMFKVEDTTIELYDLNGRKLLKKHIPAGIETLEIDVSSLKSGVYFCQLSINGKSTTTKLIIQK